MGDERLDLYYEAAEHSTHVFFLWTLDQVITELRSRGAKIGYYSFLTTPLDDLDKIAEEAGAEDQLAFGFTPLTDVTFLSLEGSKDSPVSGAKNVVYCFRAGRAKGYIGTIAMIHSESDLIGLSSASFVLASSEKSALAVLGEYNRLRRDMLRTRKVVLDLQGRQVAHLPDSRWSDIFLPRGMAQQIRREIDAFFSSREQYESRRLPYRRGLLFAGPSGNGKTAACRAIASTVDAPVLYGVIDPSDIASCLKATKRAIIQHSPCVAMFEDADAFVTDESSRGHMLGLLDDIFEIEGVLVIASTNAPDGMDMSLTARPGRFDSFYLFPNPGEVEARKILKRTLGKHEMTNGELKAVISEMAGYSGAFVQEVAAFAFLTASAEGRLPAAGDLASGIQKVRTHIRNAKGAGANAVGFSID